MDALTKSQEERLFEKYMRFSPSPDPTTAQSTLTPVLEEMFSSTGKLESYDDYVNLDEPDELEDYNLPAQVPLSSSPPDFTSSSPQSYSLGSEDSQTCSTSSHISSDLELGVNGLVQRHLNGSTVELQETSGINDFTQKLHRLLLAVLEERRQLKASSPTLNDVKYQDGLLTDRSNSLVSASSGSSFWNCTLQAHADFAFNPVHSASQIQLGMELTIQTQTTTRVARR